MKITPDTTDEEYRAYREALYMALAQAQEAEHIAVTRRSQIQREIDDTAYDFEHRSRCAATVDHAWYRDFRCTFRRGYGPNGNYCKRHATMPTKWLKEDREHS